VLIVTPNPCSSTQKHPWPKTHFIPPPSALLSISTSDPISIYYILAQYPSPQEVRTDPTEFITRKKEKYPKWEKKIIPIIGF